MTGFKKIKKGDARIFFEGKEMCREYCSTGKITFGTSHLFPGEEGAVDPGHAEAHEVFFVVEGRVVMSNENGLFVELEKGDADRSHCHRPRRFRPSDSLARCAPC